MTHKRWKYPVETPLMDVDLADYGMRSDETVTAINSITSTPSDLTFTGLSFNLQLIQFRPNGGAGDTGYTITINYDTNYNVGQKVKLPFYVRNP